MKNNPFAMLHENEFIKYYSDKDLEDIAKQDGLEGMIKIALFDTMFEGPIKQIMEEFKLAHRRELSDEVEDYFNFHRAKSIIENNGLTFQTFEDDRCGINLDNAFIHFKQENKITLPFSNNERFDHFQRIITNKKDEKIMEILVRTPEEYIKLLIYYIKLDSFDKLKLIYNQYQNNLENIKQYGQENKVRDGIRNDIVEFIISPTSARLLEDLFKTLNINSVEKYIELFIKTPYSIVFLQSVSYEIIKYIIKIGNIKDINGFIEILKHKNLCKRLSKISFGDYGTQNLITLFEHFKINNLDDIINVLNKLNTIEIIKKANNQNLINFLKICNCNNIDEFEILCSNPNIFQSIENTNYPTITHFFKTIGLSKSELDEYMLKLILNGYNNEIEKNFNSFIEQNKSNNKIKNNSSLKQLILYILFKKNPIDSNKLGENLLEIGKIIDVFKNEDNINYLKLKKLYNFMKGTITAYLGEKLIKSNDEKQELIKWTNTIKSFEDGNFDAKNELHQNLEYKRFLKIVSHDSLKTYMPKYFSFEKYLSIFDHHEHYEQYESEKTKFEIECVAYETSLLKEYIYEIKERADRLNRKLIIVPNLSYGYLPTAPIIDELTESGIQVILGVKVGSTECHSNKEVINSRLFKNHRTKIINEQPIILVIDGTNNITIGSMKNSSARYPDSYQGFLNQVIAINDSYGHTKMEYNFLGKSNNDLENLRNNEEYLKTVEIYKSFNPQNKDAFAFHFWNTAGKDLVVEEIERDNIIKPIEANSIFGPAIIFCNIGVLDEQIPKSIKNRFKKQSHTPAFFDDSGRIINFEFSFNNYGVQYINNLESKLKETIYSKVAPQDPAHISEIIKHAKNCPIGIENEGKHN